MNAIASRAICPMSGGVVPVEPPTPGVVEGDDAAGGGQVVDQRGVPVVEVPAKVLEQDERRLALAGVAVGEVDTGRRAGQLVRQA
jgi:hypothetical protein